MLQGFLGTSFCEEIYLLKERYFIIHVIQFYSEFFIVLNSAIFIIIIIRTRYQTHRNNVITGIYDTIYLKEKIDINKELVVIN